jgi:hypothetical protein
MTTNHDFNRFLPSASAGVPSHKPSAVRPPLTTHCQLPVVMGNRAFIRMWAGRRAKASLGPTAPSSAK